MENSKMMDLKLGLYKHYKGHFYQVVGLCRHAETLEILVTYQALYGDYGLWVRPVNLFLGTIEENGQLVPRFKFIRTLLQEPPTLR